MAFKPVLARQQSGAVLVISLIMLLLLNIIGVTALQTTTLEEKMAGNMRDRIIAFQAAEAALRDAEADIANVVNNKRPRISGFSGFKANCGATTLSRTDDGLCYKGKNKAFSTAERKWEKPDWAGVASIAYGTYTNTGSTPVKIDARLSAPPRYVIEALGNLKGSCDAVSNFCYRITARAQGVDPNTVVLLQTVYKSF